jgi:hypothetical protein
MDKINIRLLVVLLVVVLSGSGYAQTGVGTRNPQGPLHVDGAKDNAATITPGQAANDVIITNSGFVGVGVLNPAVKLDMRSAGTENALGLGTTTMTAAAAEAGAVRYDVTSVPVGPKIEVSDGAVWSKVYVAPQKAVVVARKVSGQNIGNSAAKITNWTEVRDMSNSFNPTTGEFTAPRAGTYTFLLTFNLAGRVIEDGSRVESQFYNETTNSVMASVYKTFGHSMNGETEDGPVGLRTKSTQAGGSSTSTFYLNQGERVSVRLLHNLISGNVPLRVPGNSDPANPDAGFNNLTIIEH